MPRRSILGTRRLATGKARIVQLAEAAGIDPKTITSIDALPDLLTGVQVKIRVGLQIKDGVQVPVVRTVLGPAGPERQADDRLTMPNDWVENGAYSGDASGQTP